VKAEPQHWRWRRYVPLKRRLTFNGLHRVIYQKRALLNIIIIMHLYPEIWGSHSSDSRDMTPCSLVESCRSFGGTHRFHLPVRRSDTASILVAT
jgi:hypothetical protein